MRRFLGYWLHGMYSGPVDLLNRFSNYGVPVSLWEPAEAIGQDDLAFEYIWFEGVEECSTSLQPGEMDRWRKLRDVRWPAQVVATKHFYSLGQQNRFRNDLRNLESFRVLEDATACLNPVKPYYTLYKFRPRLTLHTEPECNRTWTWWQVVHIPHAPQPHARHWICHRWSLRTVVLVDCLEGVQHIQSQDASFPDTRGVCWIWISSFCAMFEHTNRTAQAFSASELCGTVRFWSGALHLNL